MKTMKKKMKDKILDLIIWKWKLIYFDLATPCGSSKRSIRIRYWKFPNPKFITVAEWRKGEKDKLEAFLYKHGIDFYW